MARRAVEENTTTTGLRSHHVRSALMLSPQRIEIDSERLDADQ
jgi:hypothetical protein